MMPSKWILTGSQAAAPQDGPLDLTIYLDGPSDQIPGKLIAWPVAVKKLLQVFLYFKNPVLQP
jgi:hypothetical protein